MKAIIKTLVLSNTPKKWSIYWTQFHSFYKERDAKFDEAITFIKDFYTQFDSLPSWDIFYAELSTTGEIDLQNYLTSIVQDQNVPAFADDAQFSSYLGIRETEITQTDLNRSIKLAQNSIDSSQKKDAASLFEKADNLVIQIQKIKQRAMRVENSTTALLFGDQGADLQAIYEKNKKERTSGEHSYYGIGLDHFKNLKLRKGQLITIGGFTSEGKSIWLRYLTYILAVNYGLNGVFFSFEMPYDEIRAMFSILHANNKKIFPNTPKVSLEDFNTGMLTDEQEDFLWSVADPDLLNNPNYGSILIDQPNKPRYRMIDLQERLTEIENSIMPIHVTAIDYLTMMYPITSDKGRPDTSDYNQMFKDFKNMAMTHRCSSGEITKFIAISAAQISRAGRDEAKKNEGVYDISAFSHYSEIERSSDILLTSYAPEEFRAISKSRLQNLKNRGGAVQTTPMDLHCDYGHSYMLGEIESRSEAELVSALQSLNL